MSLGGGLVSIRTEACHASVSSVAGVPGGLEGSDTDTPRTPNHIRFVGGVSPIYFKIRAQSNPILVMIWVQSDRVEGSGFEG